jgi:hypothetical protein
MAKHSLKAWLADNLVTTDDPTDKIAVVELNKSLSQDDILNLMTRSSQGVERGMMQFIVDLFQRTIAEQVCEGNSVNVEIARFAAQLRGVVIGKQWDTSRNSIYVSITQGRALGQEIQDTNVKLLGDKPASIQINATSDAATGATDFSATPNSQFIALGKNLKLAGDDPSVGIEIIDAAGNATRIAKGAIGTNNPGQLTFIMPNLKDGTYTLRVTTQYTNGSATPLKSPRSVEQPIYIGTATPTPDPNDPDDPTYG